MNIKILGSGCKNCIALEKHVKQALEESGKVADVVKVTDFAEIAKFNVMKTPALVINEKLVSSGRVSSVAEIKSLLET